MNFEADSRERAALHEFARVVRRRKWVTIGAALLTTAVALTLSFVQQERYQASAKVLLSRQNLANSLNNIQDYQQVDPVRQAQTQADLAASPIVAARTLKALGLHDRTAKDLLAESQVVPEANADLLTFKVDDSDPHMAARLATQYAQEFQGYRRELDSAPLMRAQSEVQRRIARLERSGSTRSQLYSTLVSKVEQLKTLEALQTSNAFVVRSADGAVRIQPRSVRNGVLAAVLGVLLGLGLAFLRDAFDTRIRSAEELADGLNVTLLGRLPTPKRQLAEQGKLAMVEEPRGRDAEALRVVRTSLEFMAMGHDIRTIMVTSAMQAEGKSTTVSNLAVAYALAGRHVALVDLDLRRPTISRYFPHPGQRGLADVALGKLSLDDALVTVAIDADRTAHRAQLEVLTPGLLPPDPGEFVGSPALARILEDLCERVDLVLIDAPPLLSIGDALTLSRHVDALFLVARLNLVRRPTVRELRRVLGTVPARVLGFVLTGEEEEEGYGDRYGYSYGYDPSGEESGQRLPEATPR